MKIQENKKIKKGFAVLFSILLASFLITLGISIFSISLKEIQIATSARDSQIAYYIADSAKECALYWDVKFAKFPSCMDSTCATYLDADGNSKSADNTINVTNVTCHNTPQTLSFVKDQATLTYSARLNNFFLASSTSPSSPVSDIVINKTYNTGTNRVVTTIIAYGHNTGILGRRVERGIQQINN